MSESTQLTPQMAFEEKVKERIRDSIGDLMPDEVLVDILRRAIEEQFFEQTLTEDRWGSKHYQEPWLLKEVGTLLNAKLKGMLQNVLEEREAEIGAAVAKTIEEQAPQMIAAFLMTALDDRAKQVSWQSTETLRSRIQEVIRGNLQGGVL